MAPRGLHLLAAFAASASLALAGAAVGCNAITGVNQLSVGTGGSSGHSTGAHSATATSSSGHGGGTTGHGGHGGTTAAGGSDAGLDPCAGMTCSGHGTCSAAMGQATCTCVAGYHAVGLTCVVDEKCTATTCGNCAMCGVVGGVTQCTCPPGYSLQGIDCQLTTDPCSTTQCAAGEACVSEAHCQALGACVQTCDCSNCPNCSPGSDWSTEQEFCGAGKMGPATMACNKPCTGGAGCLPYATQICWPLEGCFSK